jgi:hypothetical protein
MNRLAAINCLRKPAAIRFQESRMSGNLLVRFDEGRAGRTPRCRPLSYSTETLFCCFTQRRRVRGEKNSNRRSTKKAGGFD